MTALPSIELLRSLFHYNPLAGTISYLHDRGPRRAGEPAGGRHQGKPTIHVAGRRYGAAAVAWALQHGADPSPQHVICLDGNPQNLVLSNLALSDIPPSYKHLRSRGKTMRRMGDYARHIKWNRTLGAFTAKYDGEVIGEFTTKRRALEALRAVYIQNRDCA